MTDQEHKEESLLDIIGGCSDDSKHEEKQKILAKFRFASELQQKTLVPADLSLADLEEAIYTAAYLGLSTENLVTHFKIVIQDHKKFKEYFFHTGNDWMDVGNDDTVWKIEKYQLKSREDMRTKTMIVVHGQILANKLDKIHRHRPIRANDEETVSCKTPNLEGLNSIVYATVERMF